MYVAAYSQTNLAVPHMEAISKRTIIRYLQKQVVGKNGQALAFHLET
jgi:hypothetical protein